ncbi:uncharacterized protein LOC100118488 [Nasonia vitripennis]|uniref:CUB domain-containing protein n=1 Tax=Nasonia vitripennis TaxID=7425 RepID=A0A7M7G7L3_NASVI|nr:uncharacterized protein LOC100118488 [Nasonia vitripennis]
MFGPLLVVALIALTVTSGQHGPTLDYSTDEPRDVGVLQRQKRFFPLFSVVRFPNSPCTASNSFNGTCFTKRECAHQGGTAFGTCANGFGVCCLFQKSCGTTTNVNNTYFTNPSYPTTYDGGDRCVITVKRCNSNICQLRLDFLDFTLAQPTADGVCDFDLLSVSGGASRVPRICGENTDQHVYVDFEGSNPITISIDSSTEYTFKRRWNIRIQQIACDSAMRAPSGCLQYHTALSGNVDSFNYGSSTNPRTVTTTDPTGAVTTTRIGTREMANLNYGVCVKMASGYCSLRWSATDFSVTGDLTTTSTPTPASGTACTTDFIIIPNPFESGMATGVDRYCGSSLTEKTTFLKPFVLYVVTDDTEEGTTTTDTENKGFSLMYKQMICSI